MPYKMNDDLPNKALVPLPAKKSKRPDWRIGFEIEMLFGDLGIKKYRDAEEFDEAPLGYCRDIAKAISQETGIKWNGSSEPKKEGFYVVPEYDLDPIAFPKGAVGGVELITPPLPMGEAMALRTAIADAVSRIERGCVAPAEPQSCGWHINVDMGRKEDIRERMVPSYFAMGLWEGETEVEALVSSWRYGSRYTAPQHHAYGPRLISALSEEQLPITPFNLDNFMSQNLGSSKRYAANLQKMQNGYLELRYFHSEDFLDDHFDFEDRLSSFFTAMEISFSTSNLYKERTFDRFKLLNEWAASIRDDIGLSMRETKSTKTHSGFTTYQNEPLASVLWDGSAEMRVMVDDDERDIQFEGYEPAINVGLRADELVAGSCLMGLDHIYAQRSGIDCYLQNSAFEEEIELFSERYRSEGLLPLSQEEVSARQFDAEFVQQEKSNALAP